MRKKTTIICLLMSLILCLTACGNSETAVSSEETGTSSETAETASGNSKYADIYFDTDIWQAVPLVSQKILDAGYKGGEGGQWMTYIAFNSVDGNIAYGGIDVGGMYKSTDKGQTWYPNTTGLGAAGATCIINDPKNADRVLCVGVNSSSHGKNGLYLSTDCGEQWKGVNLQSVKGNRDYRNQIAFDISSYDESLGYCKIVYWSRENDKNVTSNNPLIYKSEDGGETWSEIAGTAEYAGGDIAVAPNGDVYAANSGGVYKSTDHGAGFVKVESKSVNTLRIVNSTIYALASDGVYVSTDNGAGFTNVTVSGLPKCANHLAVSPTNPNKMVLQDDQLSANGQYNVADYYSNDGGKTWTKASANYDGAFLPYNPRQHVYSFCPGDENIVLTLGGDFIMRSTDGGKSYRVSNDGYVGLCTGGKIRWNVNDSNLLFVGSQDYNGAYTADGGKTWTYLNWKGSGWGGFTYGGYALTDKVVFSAVYDSWASKGAKGIIYVTYDGGKTFTNTGLETTGYKVGMGCKDSNIAFMGEYRTTDGAKTWTKMEGCTGVFTMDPETGTLYGADQYYLTMSTDNGATWTRMLTLGSNFGDMAYNTKDGKLYVATDGALYRLTPGDKKAETVYYAASGANSVAIDNSNPDIIYVGCGSYSDYSADSVMRSLDGGKTWTRLSRYYGDGRTGPDGAHSVGGMCINQGTGELYVISGCRGIWKIPRPNV